MKRQTQLPIALFNGTIATTNGLYSVEDISRAHVQELLKKHGFISAIGHEATAQIMSDVLGYPIEYNRIQFKQQVGQWAVVFKLNERPPEGVILSRDEVEKIGYSFKIMKRIE